MHYTPKFQAAFEEVKKIAEEKGIAAGKVAFRDAMLSLGHDERIRNLYRIQDKLTKKAVFFAPNRPQEQYLKQKSTRNIILKCRQVGFTTLNCIRALDYALWEPNSRTGVLCHKLGTVKTIFNDITKFCYNWFTRDWGHLYSPVQKADSATSLSFVHDGLGRPLESSILVMHDFRGKTLHFLHVSEAARVDGDRLVGSVNGVPANGEVTLESTASGQAGEFYRLWRLWRAETSLAPYKGYFVPWFKHYPEEPDKWEFIEKPNWTPREHELLESYAGKITAAHLLWRRWCINSNCEGEEEKFENEYPTNDLDCFLSNSASVFPNAILRIQVRNTREPVFIGHVIQQGKNVEVTEDPKGIIAIWEEPEVGHTYVIGCDPSGGVGKDRGAAYVKDQKTNKHVARIWGDLQPADMARELYKLANFYNRAWVCVEANNHGHVVIETLKNLQYRNLYKRQALDELTNKPTKKVGFLTTNQSKIMITERLKSAAKESKVIIRDKDLIAEMSTFIQLSGKAGNSIRREASDGAHDDLVMAAALTEEMDFNHRVDNPDEYSREQLPDEIVLDPETGFIVG